ncbi:hypothetical protein HZU75_07095 [Chitinibacter fontanus]|uniref:Uncharacterized protein n=1 Tax=Chitinibacter fontanus TaxID=1737446 RepID=A0A7D5ZF29_9NEIS|nr:hypothetical protein [Chitinibacter fontanus]QLI81308.1 hypothetical protein HZU75_07095 [Chitinibacter fontanus]
MQQFKTLMLREWMQHRRSWLILGLWSPVIVWALVYLVLLTQGTPQFSDNIATNSSKIAAWVISAQTSFVLYFSLIGVLFTVPGLPYRDKDDKSLAFWRSLPINERAAVGAPILMHGIVLPLLAITAAIGLNVLLSAPMWITHLSAGQLGVLLAGVFGTILQGLLSLIWLLPLVLLLALGNSAVRRWGMVLVIIGAAVAQSYLSKMLPSLAASRFVEVYFSGLFGIISHVDFLNLMASPGQAAEQFSFVSSFALNLPFVINLAVSALCIGALIWRRQTGQTA